MGDRSGIEWTMATWNPLAGCSLVSAGCKHCYAMTLAHRLARMGQAKYQGLTTIVNGHPVWTGEVRLVASVLDAPLRWAKPRRIFVNSMSDLFHEAVKDEWIDRIFAVMALAPQHTFQVLTKRPGRMRDYASAGHGALWKRWGLAAVAMNVDAARWMPTFRGVDPLPWPLPHVWLGVSCEDQATADARIPLLLQTPAAVRWVSLEPQIGPVDLSRWLPTPAHVCSPGCDYTGHPDSRSLSWVVIGGESGPGARPFDLAWARAGIAQGKAAGVPVFVKQLGARPTTNEACEACDERGRPRRLGEERCQLCFETGIVTETHRLNDRKGGDMTEWPADLRVREYPRCP